MSNKELDFYYTQLAWKRMNKEDILFDFIKKYPNKRKYEFVEELVHKTKGLKGYTGDNAKDKRIMSYTTLNKHLLHLRKIGKITQNKKDKTYLVNPNYIELSENSEEQLKLMFERELNKIRDYTVLNFQENKLWLRIHNQIRIWYNFGEELKDKIYFSNEIAHLMGRLFNSLIRECIIMNPELWHVMDKPEHYNFTFGIECNLQEDPKIIELINELKNECIERKEVHLFSVSPFSRRVMLNYEDIHNIILEETNKQNLKFKIDRSLKELYEIAIGQSTLLKKQWEKEEKQKQENYEEYEDKILSNVVLKNIPYSQKLQKDLGKREEYKSLYKKHREKLDQAIKELQKEQNK